jgi:hypothetical protein
MKRITTGVSAVIIAAVFAGCGSNESKPAATVREIKIHSPEPVLEFASVAGVAKLSKDRRGEALIRTENGSRYIVSVGKAPAIRVGDRVIVKPVADSQEVTISVNDKIYSGSIAN